MSISRACTVAFLDDSWNDLPSNIQAIYSFPNGTRKQLGDLVQNFLLADTLEKIAANGSRAFYMDLSQSIIDTVQEAGGILDAADLANYQVKVEEPVSASFNGEIHQHVVLGL